MQLVGVGCFRPCFRGDSFNCRNVQCAEIIRAAVDEDAEIIYGTSIDESYPYSTNCSGVAPIIE